MPGFDESEAISQFRAHLAEAGVALTPAEVEAFVSGGGLKPLAAFRSTFPTATDLDPRLPDYLGPAGGWPESGEGANPLPPPPAPMEAGDEGLRSRSEGLGRWPIHALAPLLKRGEISPVEVLEDCLRRIEERDGRINAFQLVLVEEARAAARRAEAELARGECRGPLHGVPVAIKDLLDLEGYPTTAGSAILAGTLAGEDATAVARLKAAGAIIIGKTRMSEFAYSPASNNDHYGPTANPWDPSRDSGGSSSGSAAAVADGMAVAALGTDTGGSIRIPGAFCGLLGLKPTFGRLGLGGCLSLAWSLDHLGPLARDSRDAGLLLDLLEGPDPRDPRTWSRPPRGPSRGAGAPRGRAGDLRGLRVGVLAGLEAGKEGLGAAALEAYREGLRAFEAAGARLVEVDLPDLPALRLLNTVILAIEAAAVHLPLLRRGLGAYGDFPRLRLLSGFAFGPLDLVDAQKARARLRASTSEAFAVADFITMPTMSDVAPLLGRLGRLTYTSPFNLLGWPAATVPLGSPAGGEGGGRLPLGVQIVGPAWSDREVLGAAAALEAARGSPGRSS